MKIYNLYSKGKELELVKCGFSWPAFMFSWSWFFYHNMLKRSVCCLLILIGLTIEINSKCLIIAALFLVYLGVSGNDLFETYLLSNKWNYRFTIKARNYIEAWWIVANKLIVKYRNSIKIANCDKETSKQT